MGTPQDKKISTIGFGKGPWIFVVLDNGWVWFGGRGPGFL